MSEDIKMYFWIAIVALDMFIILKTEWDSYKD